MLIGSLMGLCDGAYAAPTSQVFAEGWPAKTCNIFF